MGVAQFQEKFTYKNRSRQPLWKTVWQCLKILNTELAYDPAIPFLGIYLREMKAHVNTKTCIRMSIAAFFVISKR